MSSLKDRWIAQQSATYVRWLNTHLPAESHIAALPADLSDGVALNLAASHLFSAPLPRGIVRDAGASRIHRIANVALALQLLARHGVHTALAPDAVVDGKAVLVLGLVWRLIVATQLKPTLKSRPAISVSATVSAEGDYAICDAATESAAAAGALELADAATRSARDALLAWCRETTDLPLRNFSSDWASAVPFVALVDALAPGAWRWKDRSSLAEAFRAAQLELGIAPLLDVADLADAAAVDERSVMTYVSEFVKKRKTPLAPIGDAAPVSTLFANDDDDDDNDDDARSDAPLLGARAHEPEAGYGFSGGVLHEEASRAAEDDADAAETGYGFTAGVAPAAAGRRRRSPSEYAEAPDGPAERQSVFVSEKDVRAIDAAAAATDAAAMRAAGYGEAEGVAPAARASKLVQPKYLVSPEDAEAAGYAAPPRGGTMELGQVEYFDPTQKYADYQDSDDLDDDPSDVKKVRAEASTLVSVRPAVSLASSTSSLSAVKAPKPSMRHSGFTRRGPAVVGTISNDDSTRAFSAAAASAVASKATPTPTSTAAPASRAAPSTTTVTVAAVSGHKAQPQVTTMSYQGGALVSVEQYRDGRLVQPGDDDKKAKKKDKKNPQPSVSVTVSNSSTKAPAAARPAAAAAEETPSGELCSIKCPSCFKRNKYHRGTERLMCHACKTTFRVPS